MRALLLAILFTLPLSIESLANGEMCTNTGALLSVPPETEFWVDFTRFLALDGAKEDLKGFCEWNRMDRVAGEYLATVPDGFKRYQNAKLAGDREAAANAMMETMAPRQAPWQSSLMGHPKLKNRTSSFFKGVCGKGSALKCAAELAETLASEKNNAHYNMPGFYSRGEFEASNKQLLGACGLVANILKSMACAEASKDMLKFMELHHSLVSKADITGVPLIKETLTNQKITKALQKVSVNLWQNIAAKNFDSRANIFSELTHALTQEGYSEAEAKRESLKILGAIATGGPNFGLRVNLSEIEGFPSPCKYFGSCNMNSIYMQAIAEGMALADTIKMEKNQPMLYSLPENANYNCDSGKSYNFWMSAAITQELMDLGHSKDAAQAAAYVGHIGYQMSDSGDRNSSKLLGRPRYGAVENGVRIDLNLASAGAAFGANLMSKEPMQTLDLKRGLLSILEKGNSTPADPEEEFSKSSVGDVMEWVDRIAAKSAFAAYR